MVPAIPLASAPFNPGPPSVVVASTTSVADVSTGMGGGFGRGGKASTRVRENGWLVDGRISRARRAGDAILCLE